jgi:hypothetical protein
VRAIRLYRMQGSRMTVLTGGSADSYSTFAMVRRLLVTERSRIGRATPSPFC